MGHQGVVRSLVGIVVGVAACVPVAVASHGTTVSAQAAPYVVALPNGGFESPGLAAGSQRLRPTNASWTFIDQSGVSRAGAAVTAGAPAIPQGTQVGYIRNSSKIVQQVWLEPGDQLRFRATQTKSTRTGLQSLAVVIDGQRVGAAASPGDGSWTTHTVALGGTTPRRVFLELRGLTNDITDAQSRTALIDDVEILRQPVTIPNGGIPARQQRGLLNPRPLVLGGGVQGVLTTGDSEPLVDTSVQAIAQSGNRMFIGGKFAHTQRGKGAPLENQAYLAAFDRATGNWIDTFRPTLDGTVWDLVVVDGKLIVAGQFTSVNGQSTASGLAALDPVTGALVPGWQADLGLVGGSIRPFARTLDVIGKWLVVGGRFNRITGSNGIPVSFSNLARVAIDTGTPAGGFRPAVNGQVYDVDAVSGQVYAVGKFTSVNGEERRGLARVSVTDGTSIAGTGQLQFSVPDPRLQYTQAVTVIGPNVWVGGSQHHTELYDATVTTRARSFLSNQGDIQAFATLNGYLYSGSHANLPTYLYTGATANQGMTGWITRDPIRWISAIDLSTRAVVPLFVVQAGTHSGEGAWELFVDSGGCLWAGGDFKRGAFVQGVEQYGQGFLKFCPVDTVAPSTPPNLAVSITGGGPRLTWGASTDNRAGGIRYDVFRNDRMIAEGITTRSFTDAGGRTGDRYVVRSSDLASNRSASTTVVTAPADVTPPKTPQNLTAQVSGRTVTLTWTAPTDNVGVVDYQVFDNPAQIRTVTATTVVLSNLAPGTYSFAVRARDAAGNVGNKTAPVAVTIA